LQRESKTDEADQTRLMCDEWRAVGIRPAQIAIGRRST